MLKQKAARGVFWTAFGNLGRQGISLVVFLVLARLLSAEDFGLVAMASVFVALGRLLADQGMAEAIVQRKDVEEGHLNTAFVCNLVFNTFFAGTVWLCAGAIAELYRLPDLELVLQWLCLVFVFGALTPVQEAYLRKQLRFRELSLRDLIGVALGGIVGLAMAWSGAGVWSLVGQQIAQALGRVITLWAVSGWRPKFAFSRQHFGDLANFALHRIGTQLLQLLGRRGDDFLIGFFLGATALGYYVIAYRIMMALLQLITTSVRSVAFPVMAELQHDRERLQRAFFGVLRLVACLSFPVFLGAAATAPELVPTLVGPNWALSVPVMQLLMMIGMLQALFIFHEATLSALGRQDLVFRLTLWNSSTNFLVFFFAVPWGIVAVAAAYMARGYLSSPIPLYLLHRFAGIKMSSYVAAIWPQMVSALVMVAALMGLRCWFSSSFSPALSLTIMVAVGAVLYASLLALLSPSLLNLWRDILGQALGRKAFPSNSSA